MPTMHPRCFVAIVLTCLAVAVPSFAAEPNSAEDDRTVVLSPFEVRTEKDVGYLAQSTLAGSRLNTNLKDVGAAVSVITLEFLRDVGVTNMRDLILFQNNAVPEFGDSASNFNANPLIGNAEWQLRIRGLPASYARNYFVWQTPTDFYNVDRIDQSRGPNSILFGFGSAGGIVNTTTKQATFGAALTDVALQVGSYDRYRGELDVNRVLVKDVLALRVNLVAEDANGWREFETYETQRGHVAATWRPTRNSTVRAEFEAGDVRDNVARPWLMIDQSAAWRDAGRPTYAAPQWSSTIVNQTWSEHLVYIENNNTLADWKNLPFSYSSTAGWAHLAMTPENLALIPIRSNPGGPAARRDTDYHTYTAIYENRLTEDFTVEAAFNHQTNDFLGFDPNAGNLTRYGYLGDATELWGDASTVTPTGDPNPYAGQLYVENNWTRRTQSTEVDNLRLTGAYEWDGGRAGRHRLAGLFERSWRDYLRREDAEVFLGRPFAPEAEFDSNRVFRRYYIQPGVQSSIRVPTWERALTDVVDVVSGRRLTSGWAPNQEINNSEQVQDTLMAAVQSRFFGDRLITTLGYRHDVMDYSTQLTARNPTTGQLELGSTRVEREFRADTETAGAVYHVSPQFSVYGNFSNSRNLPNVNQRIINQGIPPMPEGVGSDFGVKLDLLDGRLYATVGYYTTDVKNTSEWGNINANITALNTRVLQALETAGRISAADRSARIIDANAYLEDRKASGWEVSLVANPTPTWRLSANFSTNEVEKENIMNEVKAWADENTAFWLSRGGSDFLLGGGDWDTIGNQVGWLYQFTIDNARFFNGKPARGERKYGANFWSHHRIPTGPLEGLSFGIGGRYQSANIIGVDLTTSRIIEGREIALLDAALGYDFRLKLGAREVPVSLQLNVNNLLDSDRYQVYTTAWWDTTASTPERIGLQEPRRYSFTARFSF